MEETELTLCHSEKEILENEIKLKTYPITWRRAAEKIGWDWLCTWDFGEGLVTGEEREVGRDAVWASVCSAKVGYGKALKLAHEKPRFH